MRKQLILPIIALLLLSCSNDNKPDYLDGRNPHTRTSLEIKGVENGVLRLNDFRAGATSIDVVSNTRWRIEVRNYRSAPPLNASMEGKIIYDIIDGLTVSPLSGTNNGMIRIGYGEYVFREERYYLFGRGAVLLIFYYSLGFEQYEIVEIRRY